MLTIITPCCRQLNIPKLFDSILFQKISKWIIVYDTSKDITYDKLYTDHPQISEYECNDPGIVGNSQRNFALNLVHDGFVYFLDDDNIIHPNFWSIVDTLDENYFYTFDQLRTTKMQLKEPPLLNRNISDNYKIINRILLGNNIRPCKIDTAMFIVHKKMIRDIKWSDKYAADGIFISEIYKQNENNHIYINETCCYYNYLVNHQ